MNNMDEKITKINSDHNELIAQTKSSLLDNKKDFVNSLNEVGNTLKLDDTDKRYITLLQIKELIDNLTKEILETKNEEEIIKLRKKLNYYISKVRKELEKRNVSSLVYQKYIDSTNSFRKDVSRYLRYEKRNSNIVTINDDYEKIDTLSKDELKDFKRRVNLENNYNKRNLLVKEEKPIKPVNTHFYFENFKNIDEYVLSKINMFNNQYHIEPANAYHKKTFKNLRVFFKNIPIYRYNKSKAYTIIKDLPYYRGGELVGYLEYVKEHNSLFKVLNKVLNRTVIDNNIDIYSSNNPYALKWIKDYCDKNELEISYSNEAKILKKD